MGGRSWKRGQGDLRVTLSMWAPGRPFPFILREIGRHEKILSQGVKFIDIAGCGFANRTRGLRWGVPRARMEARPPIRRPLQ